MDEPGLAEGPGQRDRGRADAALADPDREHDLPLDQRDHAGRGRGCGGGRGARAHGSVRAARPAGRLGRGDLHRCRPRGAQGAVDDAPGHTALPSPVLGRTAGGHARPGWLHGHRARDADHQVGTTRDRMIARYTRPELAEIWSDHARFEAMRKVEVAACEEMEGPSASDLAAIREATFTVADIEEREKLTD